MDAIHLIYAIPAFISCLLLWYVLPFADRTSLLRKLADRAGEDFTDVSVSGNSLNGKLRGRQIRVKILEHTSVQVSSQGSSRRKSQSITVSMKLPDSPSGLKLSRDTLGSTIRSQDGVEELIFGDSDFDNAFWVTANDEEEAREYLDVERRKWLAYYFGRQNLELARGTLEVSRTRLGRFGVATLERAVRPFANLAKALDGESTRHPKPGFILRAQLRTWVVPTLMLGWMATMLAPAEATFQTIAGYLFKLSHVLGAWLVLGIPGAQWLFRLLWPLLGLFFLVCAGLLIWQGSGGWYQQLGHLAALSLFGILVWIAWKDLGRRF